MVVLVYLCCAGCGHAWRARNEHAKKCPSCKRWDWCGDDSVQKITMVEIGEKQYINLPAPIYQYIVFQFLVRYQRQNKIKFSMKNFDDFIEITRIS